MVIFLVQKMEMGRRFNIRNVQQTKMFTHGRATDILKVSQTMGMSAVQGHYHTKFLIQW